MARLKSICRIIVDGDWIESKDQSESGIRLIQTGNIGIGEYLDKSNRAKYITAETFERLKCTEVFPGDILISRLPDPIGRACAVPQNVGKAITAVDCTIVRLDSSVCDINYFINYTQSARYSNELSKYLAGTTRTRISRKNLEKIEIPLPSLEEQRRIAALLDKVSDLIAKRRAQLDKLDLLVKARFVEMFGDQEINTKGWYQSTVGECCTLKSGTLLPADKENEGGSVPYIKVGDMNYPGNEYYITTSSRYVSRTTAGSGVFPVGTVIFPKRGGAIGTNKKRLTTVPICADLNVMGVIAGRLLHPGYLMTYFSMVDLGKLDNGSSVPQINNKDISPLRICLPPMELQEKFTTIIKQSDKTKLTIQQSLDRLETLKNALMQQYFE